MGEPESPGIRVARAYVKANNQGNIGYIGALEFEVERAEKYARDLEQAGDALALMIEQDPRPDAVMAEGLLAEWKDARDR